MVGTLAMLCWSYDRAESCTLINSSTISIIPDWLSYGKIFGSIYKLLLSATDAPFDYLRKDAFLDFLPPSFETHIIIIDFHTQCSWA